MADAQTPTMCKVCREEIRPGAQTCIHCNSRQGWQRHLGLSSTMLALLVALISVLQSAVPVFVAAYRGDRSEASMQFLKSDGLTAIFAASNSGNRPGALAFGSLLVKSPVDDYSFPLQQDADVPLILPSQMTAIRLRLEAGYSGQISSIVEEVLGPPATQAPPNSVAIYPPIPATLAVEVIQFDGTRSSFSWPVFVECGGTNCNLREKVPESGSPQRSAMKLNAR
jgi:hypothetical protein